MASASILEQGSDGFNAAIPGLTGSSHAGTFQQLVPADLIGHWQEALEEATGFSLEALFNVSVLDLEQRIDITLGEEGFNVDIVPLGTNRLSFQIRDNKAGVAADFAEGYDPGFALQGNAEDLNYLDLFEGVATGNRDFFIEYSGLVETETPGAHSFRYSSVGGFTLMIDGVAVLTVPPGGAGEAVIEIPLGLHRIQIVAEHDPLQATSPTARTDDDLQLTVRAPGATTHADLFDLVRTEPAALIAASLVAQVNGGAEQRLDLLVEDTADLQALAQQFLEGLGATGSDAVQLTIATTAEVGTAAAGYYSFGTGAGGTAVALAVDGSDLVAAAGSSGRVFLTAGHHEITTTALYESWAALAAADTTITWRGDATGGQTLPLLGGRPALADGFVQTLNDLLEGAEGFVDGLGLLPLDLGFIEASPTLSFSLGLDAELGWAIDLPSLGATSTMQPVTFALNVGTTVSEAGAFVTAMVSDLMFLTPTTRTSVLELGGFDLTAGFALPETQLGDVGFYIATSPVAEDTVNEVFGADNPLARLNSALDGLFRFKIQLDKTLSLDEIIGIAQTVADASGAARDPDKGFDLGAFLQGLYSGEIDAGQTIRDFAGHVAEADWEAAFNLFFRVTGLAPDAAETPAPDSPGEDTAAGGGGTDTMTGGAGADALTVETADGTALAVTAEELLALVRSAAFTGATPPEGGAAGGGGGDSPAAAGATVAFTDEILGLVQVKVDSVAETAESSGLADAFAALNQLFEQGFEIMTGVHLDLDLPIGEVLEFRGFDGTLDADDPGAAQDGLSPITTITTAPVIKLTTRIEEAYNNAAIDAIDAMLQKPDLTALERKQLINAKIMASLQPLMLETIEAGASAEVTVSAAPFIHAAVDVFLSLIDGISGGIDSLADVVGLDLDLATDLADDPDIDAMFADPALMEANIRTALQPLGEVLKSLPDIIDAALKAVGTLFVDYDVTKPNPAHEQALIDQGIDVIRAVGNWDLVLEFAAENDVDPETLLLVRDHADGGLFRFVGKITGTEGYRALNPLFITESQLIEQFGNHGTALPDATLPDPQLLGWVTSIPEFFRDDLAGAVTSVKDFVVKAINDAVAWADLGIAGDWRPELTELLSSLGFNFSYDEERDSYSLRVNDSPLAFIGDIESGITDFADILDGLAAAIRDFFVTGIDFDIDAAVDGLIEGFATTIPSMLEGVTAKADLDINLWDLDLGAALSLIQKTVFTPENLKVEYTFLGESLIADYGDAVQFQLPETQIAGGLPEVTARLIFDGSYDFEYALTPEFDFNFELFSLSLKTMLQLGDEVLFEDVLEYAMIKTTDDFDPDDPLSQYDDALIEIDRALVENGMVALFDSLFVAPFRDQLALLNGEIASLGDGSITLGSITDVAAGAEGEGFSPITVKAEVDLAAIGRGTDGNDRLRSVAGIGDLFGYAGNDRLYGGSDDDRLYGGAGKDLLYGGAGGDLIDGGSSADTVKYDSSFAGVIISLEADDAGWQTASGGTASGDRLRDIEHVIGSTHADSLTGNAGGNQLTGGAGDDSLLGGDGNDTLNGQQGADLLDGGAGVDTLSYAQAAAGVTVSLIADGGGWQQADGSEAAGDRLRGFERISGSDHADRLTGNGGGNVLAGNGGADSIAGASGRDSLDGGAGADVLTGGAGRDCFVFTAAADSTPSTADIITDFNASPQGDRIDLRRLDADADQDADQAFRFIDGAAFSGVAGQLRVERADGATWVYGDTDGDRSADLAIRLTGSIALTADSFLL